ncbi:MAG: hypothetical protein Q8N18_13615 [Opitutaceae bacterium]|nr:hypothetical protein [Opitutaceae bacterium]
MKQQNNEATARLNRVLSDTEGLTNAELRRSLQAEGVDVDAFMQRLSALAPEKREAVRTQAVQTSGTVKERLKKLVDSIVGGDDSLPSGAFARDGRKPSRAPFKDGAAQKEE